MTRNFLSDSVTERVYAKQGLPFKGAVSKRFRAELMECIINILRLHLSIDCKKVLRRTKVQE